MKANLRKPKALILRTAGTNCDQETAFAFELAGARAQVLHINQFITKRKFFCDFDILAIPGGFSYGDDIAAGKILANELKYRLEEELLEFLAKSRLAIGICNGFQVLVKAGILPGLETKAKPHGVLKQLATLTSNDSNKFEDRWVYLKSQNDQVRKSAAKCIWTKGLPEIITLPVAHGEGKFIAHDKSTLEKLNNNGQVVLRYCRENGSISTLAYPENPNGSEDNIAGICDISGRIFGLMPHPERHIWAIQSPGKKSNEPGLKYGEGLKIFINGVRYARKYL